MTTGQDVCRTRRGKDTGRRRQVLLWQNFNMTKGYQTDRGWMKGGSDWREEGREGGGEGGGIERERRKEGRREGGREEGKEIILVYKEPS